MIAPNSPVRQKEGAHGEEEEEAGGRRKGRPTGTPTPGADAPSACIQVFAEGCNWYFQKGVIGICRRR